MKISELLEQVAPTGLGTAFKNVAGAFGTGYQAGSKVSLTGSALEKLDKMTQPKTPAPTPAPGLAVPANPQDIAKARTELTQERDKAKRAAALQNTQQQAALDKKYREEIAALRSRIPGVMVPESALNEYSVNFSNDLVTLIRNQLGRADDKRKPSNLSYEALSDLLGNIIGQSVVLNKDIFQTEYNKSDDLQSYVDAYDDDGVTLSTKIKPTGSAKTKLDNPVNGVETIAKMASSGANYLKTSRNSP